MADFDVAIIGLGPVGSSAAIQLAHAGLSVVTFDRDKEVYLLPRAVNMDGEIVRGFQRIGLGEDLNSLLQEIREGEMVGFVNSKQEWLFGTEFEKRGPNGWKSGAFFDQPEMDGWLRQQAELHPNVSTNVGVEVTAISDLGDHVLITSEDRDNGVDSELSASYLIGCDGASSSVRKHIDSGWHDLGYDRDWLVLDIIANPGHTLGVRTMQICDPDRLATYICTKDPYRRWEFRLNEGETNEEMLHPDKIKSLIEEWTPAGTYEIRRAAIYTFHAATADCWRQGRIFIAGDAAHQTPPFLGQGMNAGIRDVLNLSWKLPMVLNGQADDALLDTYQTERNAHAHDLVDWAVSIGKLMEFLAATELSKRQGTPPPQPMDTSSAYGQGRTIPPLRDGVIKADQVTNDGSTGFLLYQSGVRQSGGEEILLDEILGPDFCLIGMTSAGLKMSAESAGICERLNIRIINLEDLDLVTGVWDRTFDSHEVALVRPDRYIFGHTTATFSVNDLLTELVTRLHLA
jgi:3-(3-hydroxy-phenyl)propionate hydroxylase